MGGVGRARKRTRPHSELGRVGRFARGACRGFRLFLNKVRFGLVYTRSKV